MRKRALLLFAAAGCAALIAATSSAERLSPCVLTLKYGARSEKPAGQLHVDLVVVNAGGTACRVAGFPDVELIGPVDPTFGSIYFVPDRAGRSSSIALRPGRRAHAVLTWLPAAVRNGGWRPGYLRVVVPTNRGASPAMALPWRFGAVLRQDAATHPGTYVSPIRAG